MKSEMIGVIIFFIDTLLMMDSINFPIIRSTNLIFNRFAFFPLLSFHKHNQSQQQEYHFIHKSNFLNFCSAFYLESCIYVYTQRRKSTFSRCNLSRDKNVLYEIVALHFNQCALSQLFQSN